MGSGSIITPSFPSVAVADIMAAMTALWVIVLLILAEPPSTEGRQSGPASARPADTAERQPPAEDATPTPEDILRAMQRERPGSEVLPPGSAGGRDDWRNKPQLWPEGFFLIEKTGTVKRQGEDWWFHFEPPLGDVPEDMPLLPNTHLETMVRMATTATSPMRFTVSGEVTVYGGRNYLLVRAVARAAPPAETQLPAREERIRGDAATTDVMDVLKRQAPQMAVPPSSETGMRAGAGSSASDRLLAEGSPVVRRVGRVLREGAVWTFVSDAQRGDSSEPPLSLLPNQVVESMIREAQRGGSEGLVFTVSGEVTLFFGKNYLLPRVATRRVDLGNLRP